MRLAGEGARVARRASGCPQCDAATRYQGSPFLRPGDPWDIGEGCLYLLAKSGKPARRAAYYRHCPTGRTGRGGF
jgi:hypothetical protein